jgi:hypothetical protein
MATPRQVKPVAFGLGGIYRSITRKLRQTI